MIQSKEPAARVACAPADSISPDGRCRERGSSNGIVEGIAEWLRAFTNRHGRPPTVLHIGNIANNAYILSKALNARGIHSDVLCHNYYHIMGCPEWEEAEFVGDIGDHFFPAWENVDLRGFTRPRWFAQGPAENCLSYLIARRSGDVSAANHQWNKLDAARSRHCAIARGQQQNSYLFRMMHLQDRSRRFAIRKLRQMRSLVRLLFPKAFRAKMRSLLHGGETSRGASLSERMQELIASYGQICPDRQDSLTADDFPVGDSTFQLWREALSGYDLVIGYSTDGIYPLIVGRPYFAFEHGTIRSIPFEKTGQGRLCSLTYRLAQHAFITNADNNIAAIKLGMTNFGFLPHPSGEQKVDEAASSTLRGELRERLKSDFLILHPARHHWTAERHPSWEKGNDYFIEGFARFLHDQCPTAGAIFVNWGKSVEASRALLAQLGVSDRVLWIEPQSTCRLHTYIKATDALADQFFLGSFGAILPKALRLGRPCLIALDEDRHRWCFPEMPPVINARTPAEIHAGLSRLYHDREFARSFEIDGPRWYDTYHSLNLVTTRFLDEMRKVVVA